jgi:hypothetical protein
MISDLWILAMFPFGCDANTATKDKWVGRVPFIIQNCAIHSGNANLVAIILHARNHTRLNTARVQDTFR